MEINIIPLKKNKQKYVYEGIHFPLVMQELVNTFDVILLLLLFLCVALNFSLMFSFFNKFYL